MLAIFTQGVLVRKAIRVIPEHLRPFIARQDANLYTAIDHASWRYILALSKSFFPDHAHRKYIDGLRETGISTERIPLISEMDAKLKKFGWRAVAVSGFIPPAIFMEFQSLGVLPIACDIRKLENLAYTPAPDIVHEAAGHAPIIADPSYSEYLRSYGEVARKAICSDKDKAVYEAIRNLSEVKENPISTKLEIDTAQRELNVVIAKNSYVSECTYLARMNWWTVEYGLVGPMAAPLIYGAGLLSSVGESHDCFSSRVLKIPFTLDCVNVSYDITQPQPQLFVAPDFESLTRALREYEKTMAFRRGGLEGLAKAKMAATTTTVTLDSGLQISGTLDDFSLDKKGKVAFLKYSSPTQLAFRDRELRWQGADTHKMGFSSPVGILKGLRKSLTHISTRDLSRLGFKNKKRGKLEFESGITLEGRLLRKIEQAGKILVLTFDACSVTWGNTVLYNPDWGTFDLACGSQVISVFGGAAERGKYMKATGDLSGLTPPIQKTNLTPENRELDSLYTKVREIREAGSVRIKQSIHDLSMTEQVLEERYPKDWLLRWELLELEHREALHAAWAPRVLSRIENIMHEKPDLKSMIERGLKLIA